MSLADAGFIEFESIIDPRGHLCVLEGGRQVPFDIKRVYYLYDVPTNSQRGGHAHRRLRQVLIAISGRFDVVLDDGHDRRRFKLSRPDQGLLVPTMTWRELEHFSYNGICLVLASEHYDESDYYRDYDAFARDARLGAT
jgi:hypothetical protein